MGHDGGSGAPRQVRCTRATEPSTNQSSTSSRAGMPSPMSSQSRPWRTWPGAISRRNSLRYRATKVRRATRSRRRRRSIQGSGKSSESIHTVTVPLLQQRPARAGTRRSCTEHAFVHTEIDALGIEGERQADEFASFISDCRARFETTTHKSRGLLAARVPERPAPGRVDVVVGHEPGLITRSSQVDVQTPVGRTTEEHADPTIELKMSRPDTGVARAIGIGPSESLDCAKAPSKRIAGEPPHGRRGPGSQLPDRRPTGVVKPRLVSRSWPLSLRDPQNCADDRPDCSSLVFIEEQRPNVLRGIAHVPERVVDEPVNRFGQCGPLRRRVRAGQDIESIEHVFTTVWPLDSHAKIVSSRSPCSRAPRRASRDDSVSVISIAILPRICHARGPNRPLT